MQNTDVTTQVDDLKGQRASRVKFLLLLIWIQSCPHMAL